MIENLKRQKIRTENLKYSDQQELDDIIRKTKLYLEQLFPNKIGYPYEVNDIKFKPTMTVYSMDDTHEKNCIEAWTNGKNSLINLIDTRIEEYELKTYQQTKKAQVPIVREKIVEVENTQKINQLRTELTKSQNDKSLWNKINWTTLLTIGLVILGGTFLFGKYIGENRFDKEKIELNRENELIKKLNLKLTDSIESLHKITKNIPIQNIKVEDK